MQAKRNNGIHWISQTLQDDIQEKGRQWAASDKQT